LRAKSGYQLYFAHPAIQLVVDLEGLIWNVLDDRLEVTPCRDDPFELADQDQRPPFAVHRLARLVPRRKAPISDRFAVVRSEDLRDVQALPRDNGRVARRGCRQKMSAYGRPRAPSLKARLPARQLGAVPK